MLLVLLFSFFVSFIKENLARDRSILDFSSAPLDFLLVSLPLNVSTLSDEVFDIAGALEAMDFFLSVLGTGSSLMPITTSQEWLREFTIFTSLSLSVKSEAARSTKGIPQARFIYSSLLYLMSSILSIVTILSQLLKCHNIIERN